MYVVLLQIQNILTFGDIATIYFLSSQAYYPSEGQLPSSLFGFADIQPRYMKVSSN